MTQLKTLKQYNPVWESQSRNSSESMPCGGGDIGLNVWVENGAILFYIARSGTFDENNTMLKLGRVRIQCEPNPFDGTVFRQELTLETGSVTLSGQQGTLAADVQIWVDVFSPVIHVEIESSQEIRVDAVYESWRVEDRLLQDGESFGNSYKWAPPNGLKTKKDAIAFQGNSVVFYHRNTGETVFDVSVRQQKLDSVKAHMFDPLKNLTCGGRLEGENFVPAGYTEGDYLSSGYKGWKLRSNSPAKNQSLELYLHTGQYEDATGWDAALESLVSAYKKKKKKTRQPAATRYTGGKTTGIAVLFISAQKLKTKIHPNGRSDAITSFSAICWAVMPTGTILRNSTVDCLPTIPSLQTLSARSMRILETGAGGLSLPKINAWFISRCLNRAILIC